MPERGCGTRVVGGVYLECPLSTNGMPIEYFLVDPPWVVDKEEMGLSSIGVKLIEKDGIWHVLDIVGSQYYPNVADFVEELKRLGLSRRVPKSLPFSKLTSESKIMLLHERASIANHKDYDQHGANCPRSIKEHDGIHTRAGSILIDRHKEMCVKTWWNDIDKGEEIEDGKVERTMPAFTYEGYARPDHVIPKYELAIFCSLPIQKIAVIEDQENFTHEHAMEKVSVSEIPSYVAEE
jgi:hypothetical protein